MTKLKLNVDELMVESFEAADAVTERGTVRGEELIASDLNSCWDTECGRSYCASVRLLTDW